MDVVLQIYAFVWGAVWGSFLNVVIYRLPLGASVAWPPSACGACGTPIRWFDNIPIVSYLVLRGRCRVCGAGFSPRYMLVEIIGGLLALALFRALDLHSLSGALLAEDPSPFIQGAWTWLWMQVFVFGLVAITFIDLEHLYIPDEISLMLVLVGLGGAHFIPVVDPAAHTIGALAAGGFMLSLSGVGWLIYRREALGMGDTKLLVGIGAFLGWSALPFVLFAAAVQALIATALAALYTRATGRSSGLTRTTEELDEHYDEAERYADLELPSRLAIPLGPFLALAGIEALFFGPDLLWSLSDWMMRALIGPGA